MIENPEPAQLKVLIVEDHPVTKLILLRWLRYQNFDVQFCSSEDEALVLLSEDTWHVHQSVFQLFYLIRHPTPLLSWPN